MDRFSTTAILLRRIDYGDADLILTFLTCDRGKITAIAKSAKKSVKRFGGLLDLFVVLDLVCRPGRGKGLPLLQEAALNLSFQAIRADVTRTAYASYWAELIHAWSEENIPEAEVFGLLHFALAALDAGRLPPAALSILFQMRFLMAAGLGPNLDRCGHCHRALPETGQGGGPLFDLGRGTVICSGCRTAARRPVGLSLGTVKQLRWLGAGDLDHALRVRFTPSALKESEALLEAFLPYHLGKVPRSLQFLRQIRR
jgi:DNA repair protein RecO (recombination protein O)